MSDDVAGLLGAVAARRPGAALLWRGWSPDGRDVDVLVLPGARAAVAEVLAEAGLRPAPGDAGHVVWSGASREIDVLDADAWPGAYPPLAQVAAAARDEGAALPVAAPEDRLLVFAADAVAGRPADRLAAKAEALLRDPGARERTHARAARTGDGALAALATQPQRLLDTAVRGRLPYGAAVRLAARSPAARAALRARVAARAGAAVPLPRGRPRPLLVALSGMDGSGKSTLADALAAHLAARGRPARTTWARLGTEAAVLDRVAAPVKRLLGREGSVADPVAAGGPGVRREQDAREASGRRSVVARVWVLLVVGLGARTYRRSIAGRTEGWDVVCDRWRTDVVVDLRLRYGHHPLAEAVVRRALPRPDVGILLALDAGTASARKPDDQARHVLRRAEPLYRDQARADGLAVIDATAPPEEVRARAVALVDAALAARGG